MRQLHVTGERPWDFRAQGPVLETLERRELLSGSLGNAAAGAFVSAPAAGSPRDIALHVLTQNAATLGLTAGDLANAAVTSQYTTQLPAEAPTRDARGGPVIRQVTHLYLRQRYNGLEIVNAPANVNLTDDGQVISAFSEFVPLPGSTPAVPRPTLSAGQAIVSVAPRLGLGTPPSSPRIVSSAGGWDQGSVLVAPTISTDPIPARLVYFAQPSGELRLAWNVVIATPDGQAWYDAQIDAASGVLLQAANWSSDAPSYNAVPINREGPNEAPRRIIVDPTDVRASPFGWHDTNGAPGPEYTDTRGNNVFAQEDLSGDYQGDQSPPDDAFRPNGGPQLKFDFPFDDTKDPSTYLSASITNLFHGINAMHDLTWHYGFDEAAGNFQVTNYSGQGIGGDPIIADAHDGAKRNAANFFAPPDGMRGRMQMGLQDVRTASMKSNRAGLGNPTYVGEAPFGATTFNRTANLFVAGPGNALNPRSAVSGKIVLFQAAADTNFAALALAAQSAGAAAVLFAGTAPQDIPPRVTGNDARVTLPVLGVGYDYGRQLRAAAATGVVSLTVQRVVKPARDNSMDNTVIIHEFGHGVSTRLTGGPANASSLIDLQCRALGEGWSDWLAMLVTQQPGDGPNTPRGIVPYAIDNPLGVHRYPFSVDMAVNPLTLQDFTGDPDSPHPDGTIWTAALWDMTWYFIERYGYDPNLSTGYTGRGAGATGNKLAFRMVLDAMKLQPANPTYFQARDALLTANLLLNGGADHDLIWKAFARRGMGFSGSTANADSNVLTPAFDLPPSLKAVTTSSVTAPRATLSVDFNRAIKSPVSTAVIRSFIGPGGVDRRSLITGVELTPSQTTLRFRLAGTVPAGRYTLVLSPTLRDLQNRPLDQDGDGVGGEATQDRASVSVLVLPGAGLRVTTVDDENDDAFDAADLSLREAVRWNALLDRPGQITFAPATNGKPIQLTLGAISITRPMSIAGNGSRTTTLDAGQQSRIFEIARSAGDVTISSLALINGSTGANEGGGAVRSQSFGTLSFSKARLRNNYTTAAGAGGGAIVVSGNLLIVDSLLSDNSAEGQVSFGGAIRAFGSLHVLRSTLRDNYTSADFGRGGAIRAEGPCIIEQSALFRNSTEGLASQGGAIFAIGALTLLQSTLHGNYVGGDASQGGAIFHAPIVLANSPRVPLRVTQSTVAGNSATQQGGAINAGDGVDVYLTNSIVAQNSDADFGPDVYVGFDTTLTARSSLIGSNVGNPLTASSTPDANGNLVGSAEAPIDPRLAELAYNGGPTATLALRDDSPALNLGDVSLVPAGQVFDQRGTGFARVVGDQVDLGAFEYQSPILTVGSVSGVVFRDANRNRVRDAGEALLAGWTTWIDLNQNGRRDANEPFAVTNAAGQYVIRKVPTGAQMLRLQPRAGWSQTRPRDNGAHLPTILPAKLAANWDFGVFQTSAVGGK